MSSPAISIIIATKGRSEGLEKLFESLCRLEAIEEIEPEIMVVNNADDGAPERSVKDLVERTRNRLGKIRYIRETNVIPPRPKCRGHNLAIRQAGGEILAFIDDDVEVTAGWLAALENCFLQHSYDAIQGSILVPPAFQDDTDFLRIWNRYRTIPYIDYGPEVMEIYTLTGPNMAIKREVFDRVGLFDERLGPGRSGMSEDVEFAQRMLRAGKRIGYEPRASVYHEADWSRLNDQFFRHWHEQQGRSRLLYKDTSFFAIVGNASRAVLSQAWYSLFHNEREKYRAKGRYYHYRAMLKMKLGFVRLA